MMGRWLLVLGCLLVWHGHGMAQNKKMPPEMKRKVKEQTAQVEALYTKGEYDTAIQVAREVLELRINYLGADHPSLSESLNDLGFIYQEKGDYDLALEYHSRALAIASKSKQTNHVNIAMSLTGLAGVHIARGEYKRALTFSQQALLTLEKRLGPTDPLIATSLNNLATIHIYMGEYRSALPHIERAVAINEEVRGPEHPSTATSLGNLAILYQELGDYERALSLCERALNIREKVLGSNHASVALALDSLASLYKLKGELDRALPLQERALAITKKELGSNHLEVSRLLINLAYTYQDKSEYGKALKFIQHAVDISESLGENQLSVAAALYALAGLYRAMGDYEQALLLDERVLAIRKKSLGPKHPDVAESLENLALAYQITGDYEEALPLHKQALTIRREALGPDHPKVAQSLNNLATLYEDMEDEQHARVLYQQSLSLRETGPALNNLAMLYHSNGDYEIARSLQERALSFLENSLGPNHPDVGRVLLNLAEIHWAQGQMAESAHIFQRAEDVLENHLELTIVGEPERSKRMLLAMGVGALDAAMSMALRTNMHDAMDLVFTKIIRSKGRVLVSMTVMFAAVRRHPDPEVWELWEEYRSNRGQYATQLLRGPGTIPLAQHRKNLDTLQKRARELERWLGDKSRAFREHQLPITVDAVRAMLPHDAALVEWLRYRPYDPKATDKANKANPLRYAACVLLPAGSPHCMDFGDAASIDALAGDMRDALGRNLATLPDIARQLDARIMAPVRAHLDDIRHVYLSPDGPLHLIPFAALRDESGRYLVDRYTFTYLTSGRELMHLTSSEETSSQALITANPALGEPRPGKRQAFAFTPLPEAHAEAETVAAMFRDALVLEGPDASEARMAQVDSPLIWHHAGHASFRPVSCAPDADSPDDPHLQSVLAMAGANVCRHTDGEREDDGLLTAVEAAGLDLGGTKLVVLSACESGVGATTLREETSGRELRDADGVYGLRRALVIAGSETQVMSLWRVEDRVARQIMESYYRNLLAHGMGRSEAMRQVQLSWLERGGIHASPYYWAAFVVSGNDAPLDVGTATTVPRVQPSARGCACDLSASERRRTGANWGLILIFVLAAIALRRRRSAVFRLESEPSARVESSSTTIW